MSSPIARLGSQSFGSESEPTVVAVGDTEGEAVLDALASDTARELFCAIDDDPAPPSELARRIDSSVQNVHYHLSNLEDAGLVHVVGSYYSEKGNEMDVYGVAADPIVLAADTAAEERSRLRQLLADWATGVATIGLVSVAIQLLAVRLVGSGSGVFEPASPGLPSDAVLPWLAEAVAAPGVLFFVGGVAVLTAWTLTELSSRTR